MIWLGVGLGLVPGDLTKATSPTAVLARDRQAALLLMFTAGLGFGLVVGLVALPGAGLAGLGAGLGAGLVIGAVMILFQSAWASYMIARGWLALHHQLPWSLMAFLADAHRRGVLRQAGAVYQFRHIELQHRLATRDAAGQQENASAAFPAAGDSKTA